jgi:quinol monooxygenase YgiN
MPYVVCAKWTAREGVEDELWEAARKWIGPTRQEPGNIMYVVHRDPENPRVLFFYEQYRDAEAFQAHRDSEHFQQYAVGVAIPLLDTREVAFYETVDV